MNNPVYSWKVEPIGRADTFCILTAYLSPSTGSEVCIVNAIGFPTVASSSVCTSNVGLPRAEHIDVKRMLIVVTRNEKLIIYCCSEKLVVQGVCCVLQHTRS